VSPSAHPVRVFDFPSEKRRMCNVALTIGESLRRCYTGVELISVCMPDRNVQCLHDCDTVRNLARARTRCGARRTGARAPSGGELGVDIAMIAPLTGRGRIGRCAREINSSTRRGSPPPTNRHPLPPAQAHAHGSQARCCCRQSVSARWRMRRHACALKVSRKADASAVPAMTASVSRIYVSASIRP
jgi:hypothetical protein